ncbi:MAG: methionyl-tRNA formyltransferase [Alphaproteobacteria bacterium]
MPRLRLVFMGTPDFAVPALTALLDAGHEVAAVYSQPPRPAGRGQAERPSPVQRFAAARNLAVRTPRTLRDAAARAEFAAFAADAAIVVAYGLILPQPVLDAPRLGCINIHGSLLPRWRGAAPIQRALLAGDAETGITIMQMDAGLDTGPMLLADSVPIGPRTTAADLHDRLAALGARLIVDALDGLAAGRLTPRPQPTEGACYAPKLGRDEGRIDWSRPAAALDRQVRALNPWPGTWFEHDGHQIKVLAAEPLAARTDAVPGTVLGSGLGTGHGPEGSAEGGLAIACGEGTLRLLRVQRPGRAPMDAAAFLRGYALAPGTPLPVGGSAAP